MTKKLFGAVLITSTVLMSVEAFSKTKKRDPSSVERPPQFVLLAFDGSSSLDMWRETVAFAETVKTSGINHQEQNIGFSYFINPVYYTERAYKSIYKTPAVGTATSCIGWAAPAGSVLNRVIATNNAFARGHEIASHANSHCSANGTGGSSDPLSGKTWTEENWTDEFTQFNNLLFNVIANNRITPPKDFVLKFTPDDIKGFRAPALAVTQGLWPTLKKFNFKYDTSKINKPSYWPQKEAWGGWNIPLANIKIAGSTRNTLSMDYNWFVFHTGAVSLTTEAKCANDPDFRGSKWCKQGIYLTPEKYAQLKDQMVDSYKYYFKKNYYGGRAPVQIGHHFSKWNGGAYWEGMKEFIQFVCAKPEVKCVTMKDYVAWLENLTPSQLSSYRNANFDKLVDDNTIKEISAPIFADVRLDTGDGAFEVMTGTEASKLKSMGFKRQLQVNFKPVAGNKITNSQLTALVGKGETAYVRASIVNKSGREVNWETYKVTDVGTDNQKVSDNSIEDNAVRPETADAHNTPE
jgi:hypothetical protein